MRDGSVMRTPCGASDDPLKAAQPLPGPPAQGPAAFRNGIRLFPARPDAGVVTPAVVRALLEGTD